MIDGIATGVLVGAILGIVLSNVAQWAKWKDINRDKPLSGYWKGMGVGHMMGNLLFDAVFLVFYSHGWLDEMLYRAAAMLGHTDRLYEGNIPVTPELSMVVVGLFDYFADGIVFIIGRRLRAFMPGGGTDRNQFPGPMTGQQPQGG